MKARLVLDRARVLAFRRRAGALDERLPPGADSLRRAAWAGLTDSVPRAALLSIHARVEEATSSTWEDPSLVQLWGPRFSAYVVARRDLGVFSLGRLSDDAAGLRRAEDLATRLEAFLDGRAMPYGRAGRGMGVPPNSLRYAAATGRVLIRWDGAAQPTVWTVPPPEIDPRVARLELARRYLHVLGPGTAGSFGTWAGIRPTRARATFEELIGSGALVPVRTPAGDGWILGGDEATFRAPGGPTPGGPTAPDPSAGARFLPSGDAYFLLQGADRELLVPDADRRRELWTTRVWPGALLVGGEIAGTWRRAETRLAIRAWRRPSPAEREAVEAEAHSLPIPGLRGPIEVTWEG